MDIKVIITGITGLVGEGVLFECLLHPGGKRSTYGKPQALYREITR